MRRMALIAVTTMAVVSSITTWPTSAARAFPIVGNYWVAGSPVGPTTVFGPNGPGAITAELDVARAPARGESIYTYTSEVNSRSFALWFGSDSALKPGDYRVGSHGVYVQFAVDGRSSQPTSGVVRLLQLHAASNGRGLQLALSFALRGGGLASTWFGSVGYDTPIPLTIPAQPQNARLGDFDGNGQSDVAVWRPSNGTWYVRGLGAVRWGRPGDRPVPGDYNGDGLSDLAVWRPSNGTWYVKGRPPVRWGERGDVPVPGDYDADGRTDLAVYRPSTGVWYVRGHRPVAYGHRGDVPAPADYADDGRMDIAVFDPAAGVTHIRSQHGVKLGHAGDIPLPGAYVGFGGYNASSRSVAAFYRPSTGTWTVAGAGSVQLGARGDVPVSAVWPTRGEHDRYGDVPAEFRPSNGRWYFWTPYGTRTVDWGRRGDVPV